MTDATSDMTRIHQTVSNDRIFALADGFSSTTQANFTQENDSSSGRTWSSSSELRVPLPGYPGFDPDGPTIVIQMGGELANNLAFLAEAFVNVWDMEELGVRPTLVVRHQDNSKWVKPNKEIHQCFPWLSQLNFSAGNNAEMNQIIASNDKEQIIRRDEHNISEFLSMYKEARSTTTETPRSAGYINRPILYIHEKLLPEQSSLPFSKYYHRLQQALRMNTDSSNCCLDRPDPDEVAFVSTFGIHEYQAAK